MRNIIKALGTIAAVFAVIMLVQYYAALIGDTLSGPDGMAILAIQLLIAVGAGMTLLFGIIARFLDRRANLPGSKWSHALILIGIATGLLLFVSPFVFG